jgi:signal transduction histidine kinase
LRPAGGQQRVDAFAAVEQVVALLSRDAERRQVKLMLDHESKERGSAAGQNISGVWEAFVSGTEEALNDIVSNLLVNAIEALPRGGNVKVSAARREGHCRTKVGGNERIDSLAESDS